MKKRHLILLLLAVLEPTVAQQPGSNVVILDPSKPNSNSSPTNMDSEQRAALQRYIDEATGSNQPRNDLDVLELDKVILDGLFTEIVSAPRVAQARLDLSDIQFEQVTNVLMDLQSSVATLTSRKMETICNELNVGSSDANDSQSIDVADVTRVLERSHANDSLDLLDEYQQAIVNIYELLGTANSEVFQDYLNRKRDQAKSWQIIQLPEIITMFSANPQALALQCNQ